MRFGVRRIQSLAVAAATTVLLIASTSGAGTKPEDKTLYVDSHTYTHPNQLVPVEGSRRLNMLCMGSGAPTVMLVSGADANIMLWQRFQARIATFTRVCAFDKAGFGFSDASPHPASVGHDVDDIRRLIDAAKIPRPVVLAGGSLGGEDSVLFAGRYRDSVAGMVLIDPTFVGVMRGVGRYDPQTLKKFRESIQKAVAGFAECVKLAKAAQLNRKNDKFNCLDSDYPDDPVLQSELDRQEMQPKFQTAQLFEFEHHYPLAFTQPDQAHGTFDSEDDREAEGASIDFGDMPLVVLSADEDLHGACAKDPVCVADNASWLAAHDRIARYSKVGKSILVKDSDHAFFKRPDAVVDTVREVVERVRKSPR